MSDVFPSKGFPTGEDGRVLVTDTGHVQVASAKITVGATPIALTTGTSGMKRRKLFVKNTKSTEVVVYIGDSNVTTSTGFPMYAGDELELDVNDDAVLKAVRISTSSNDGELRILEVE